MNSMKPKMFSDITNFFYSHKSIKQVVCLKLGMKNLSKFGSIQITYPPKQIQFFLIHRAMLKEFLFYFGHGSMEI